MQIEMPDIIYNIFPLPSFLRNAKPLRKKYISLKSEIAELIAQLQTNPKIGDSLGDNTFKVRLAISSKGKGKSGGARIITYTIIDEKEVWLLSIYDKAEKENLKPAEIAYLRKMAQALSDERKATPESSANPAQ
jgi:hypothetical protein